MKINQAGSAGGGGELVGSIYESAKVALSYVMPVMLPLMGLSKTSIELDQKT